MSRDREENREYMRKYRAAQKGATVTSLVPKSMSVTAAVEFEVESLPLAARRPADVAVALAMARILDDPASVPQQAQAANRLREVLADLRKEGDGQRKSKLVVLQERRASREDGAANLDASSSGVDA